MAKIINIEYIEEKLDALLNQAGRPFQRDNEDGTYQGCFYPVQFLYPGKPRYVLDSNCIEDNFSFGLKMLEANTREIAYEDVRAGDIVAINLNGHLHVGIYWKFGKMIHVFENNNLQISRVKVFKKFETKYYRVEE